MDKNEQKKLAEEAIPLIEKVFKNTLEFGCEEYFSTNKAVTGIALKQDGNFGIPLICLDDLPENITAEEVADMAVDAFRDLFHQHTLAAYPEMTRESVLENVVLQVLGRERNCQMLDSHPHIPFLDLAGIFRVPIGPYKRNSLNTALITNQIMESLGLTVEELAEAARKNTLEKFGTQFGTAQQVAMCFMTGRFCDALEDAEMELSCHYNLTNKIEINGAALILIPEILEQVGNKAGMDYYILPSSIHEGLIKKDDGLLTAQELKKIVYQNNRLDFVVKPEEVLSDNIYHYSRRAKELKIV